MREGESRAPHRGWSVSTQLVTIVASVAVLITGVGSWLALITETGTESRAQQDASFQAGLGAAAVADAVGEAETAMVGLASGFPIAELLANPAECRLTFAKLGVFPVGHIDIVLPDGRVPCSSLAAQGAPPAATHAGAEWLSSPHSRDEPGITNPFTDNLTGLSAVAVTAPITATDGTLEGFAVLVLSLAGLDEGLADGYEGSQRYVFTVHGADGLLLTAAHDELTVLGSDEPPADLIVGRATVSGLGWEVLAQQPRAAALAPTHTAFYRIGGLAAAAFVLLIVLLAVVNRRIGRPLRRLTAAAKQAGRQVNPEPVPEVGPAEVQLLAREFNTMIAARASYETQLTHHTLHDPLTGLPNRLLCLDRIGHALHAATGTPAKVAVVSVDLDRFKLVNASLGYRTGDQILMAATARLGAVLAPTDTLARTGGDGFVVCRPDAGDSAAAEGLATVLLDCLTEPFAVAETAVTLTASAGIARGRRGASAEDLIRDADTAMYAAKEAGGSRYRLIDDDLRARTGERLSLEADLRVAVAEGQLHVEYQPVINLLTGRITGAEALLRWMHPTRGSIPPLTFIPLAEDAGLIGPIGQFVLEQACRQAAAWDSAGHPVRVAVNVSGLQLHDPDFVSQVASVLHTTGLKPAQLCLELTETTLMNDAMHASDVLQDLKDVGVDLSIDDFGTGYSSLSYLKRFPVDELKIDRSFITHIGEAGQDQLLVGAMVAMGHALEMAVVAEGVETYAQMATLLTLGCRTAQGYLFSKPQSATKMSALLASGLSDELSQAVRAHRAQA